MHSFPRLQWVYVAQAGIVFSATLLIYCTGCKNTAVVDDTTLGSNVQSRLSTDQSLNGLSIRAGVVNGVVTLNGTVSNAAQRELAARDASEIAGAKTIVNNILVLGQSLPPTNASVVVAPAAPVRELTRRPSATATQVPAREVAPIERRDRPTEVSQQPLSASDQSQKQAPPPSPPPTFREITIPAGSTIPVRVTQTLDSATSQQGDAFSGAVASDILIDGTVAISQGASVSGHVDAVQEAAHFKGSSLLTVSLTNIKRMPVSSEPYTVTGKGRGKNTVEKTGIGAASGAILGGIFGGGKGAAIGAAAGGSLGAGANGITRGQQVQIVSETVVRFRTTSALTVRVQIGSPRTAEGGELQKRIGQ